MITWLKWTAPAAIAVSAICPSQAVEYLSVAAAQKLDVAIAVAFVDLLCFHAAGSFLPEIIKFGEVNLVFAFELCP